MTFLTRGSRRAVIETRFGVCQWASAPQHPSIRGKPFGGVMAARAHMNATPACLKLREPKNAPVLSPPSRMAVTHNRHLRLTSRVRGSVPSGFHRCPWLPRPPRRSEEHTSELQSLRHLVCRLLLE